VVLIFRKRKWRFVFFLDSKIFPDTSKPDWGVELDTHK
jgi:hypothetical protein